jgi:tetratricopeptide (TPR) repeat protein
MSDDTNYNDSTTSEDITPDSHHLLELKHQAIEDALNLNWQDAINVNLTILKKINNDTDTLSRIGFAYLKLGKFKESIKYFNKVMAIDPYNQIAIKNLQKLDNLKNESGISSSVGSMVSPLLFLEDPGKTRLAQCVNIASSKILANAHAGQEVYLKPKNHSVEIRDINNTYLGALPDDLSFRLIKYLSGNNKYTVFIRSVDKNMLTVLIREMERGKKFINQPSFLTVNMFQTYSRSLTNENDKPDVTPTGEDEEKESEEDTTE